MKNSYCDRRIFLNSIIVALLFAANSLTWVLGIKNSIVIVMAFIVGMYVLLGNCLFPKRVLSLIFYIILFFIASFLVEGNNDTLKQYFLEFLMMGIVALIFSQTKIDIDVTIISLCIISIPVAPFITKMDFLGDRNYGQWMGVSYGSIKFIVALLYALFFINTKKWLKFILIIPLVFYTAFFLSFGSRGAILGVAAFIVLAFLIKRGKSVANNLSILLLLLVASFVFFVPIIEYLSSLLSKLGIEFYAIDKIMAFSDSGRDLDNGRSEPIIKGLRMFLDSPIWGNGISSFENKWNIGYVHNFIVEQLLEGGLLLFVPLTFILFESFRIVLSNHFDAKLRMYIAFLISCNVIELLFSNYYWRVQGYWYLIGFVLPFLFTRFRARKIGDNKVIEL